MRRFAPRLLACALLLGTPAQAGPFTIQDLVAQQRLGEVETSPDGRWAIVAATAPATRVQRWDLDADSIMTVGRIDLFDLARPDVPRRLVDPDGRGLTPGPFSPSGRQMAVLGAKGKSVEVGIVELATGAIAWTGVRPITGDFGRALQWRSDDELVIAALDADAATSTRGYQASLQARLNAQWNKTTAGEVGMTYLASGRYLPRMAQPPRGRLVTVTRGPTASRALLAADIVDIEVSPDGARAAVLVDGEAIGAPQAGPVQQADRATRRRRLLVVDLASGQSWEPLPGEEVSTGLMTWSPSGRQLLVYARLPAAPWTQGRYWRIAPASRSTARLAAPDVESAVRTTPYGSVLPGGDWMGETPITLTRTAGSAQAPAWRLWTASGPAPIEQNLPAGPRALEATSASALVFSAGGQLFRVTADGRAQPLGPGKAMSSGAASERLNFNYRPSLSTARWVMNQADARQLEILDDQGRLTPIGASFPAAEQAVAGAPTATLTQARDDHGVDTVRLRRLGETAINLAVLNPQLARITFATPRPIRHPGPGGKTLTSWLYLPPDLPAGALAPLVIMPYPGRNLPAPPAEQAPPSPYAYANPQLLAGAGFAALVPSLPDDPDREPAQGLADRVLAIADAAKAQGEPVDLSRMGVFGHSYGGYAALVLATQTPRFKAIVASSANGDLGTHYARRSLRNTLLPDLGHALNGNFAWAETGQGRMGAPPWQDPDRYVRNSPLYHAGQITAPVMLVQGDLDGDPGQALGMFAALYRQNKDAQLLGYDGEGHVLMTPANQIDEWTRVIAFFGETLR